MRRQLPEIVGAIGVALDDRGSVRGCRNVPADIADLRRDFRRLKHHLNRFLDERNLVALNLDVGIGVLGIDDSLECVARMRGIFHLSRLGVNGRKQAVIVDDAAAQAHLLHNVEQMRLAVLVENRDETHGVDRVGIELFHVGMLLDILLENAEILLLEVGVQLVKALVVGNDDSLAAVSALQILHFAEQNGMLLAELPDLLLACLLELDEISADILLVELVELVLILEEVVVLIVIHKSIELLADQSGHIGRALLLGEIIERENLVVVVARAVFLGAVDHVVINLDTALARALVTGLDRLAHFAEACVAENSENVVSHIIVFLSKY